MLACLLAEVHIDCKQMAYFARFSGLLVFRSVLNASTMGQEDTTSTKSRRGISRRPTRFPVKIISCIQSPSMHVAFYDSRCRRTFTSQKVDSVDDLARSELLMIR